MRWCDTLNEDYALMAHWTSLVGNIPGNSVGQKCTIFRVSIGRWIIRLSTKPSYMPKPQCGHFIGAHDPSVQETGPKLSRWVLGESVYLSARCRHAAAESGFTWMDEEDSPYLTRQPSTFPPSDIECNLGSSQPPNSKS